MHTENLNELFQKKIPHRNWKNSVALLSIMLAAASSGELIVLTGPSRSGKSRVMRHVLDLIFSDSSNFKNGKFPYVYVSAKNSSKNGIFSTKDFAFRLLRAIKNPFFCALEGESQEYIFQKMRRASRETEPTMWNLLEESFPMCGVRYLVIDEAHHLLYAPNDAAGAIFDSWKCFCETTGVILIVVGAYPILDVVNTSSHMLGRKYQVELSRYHKSPEDLEEFMGIVKTYEKILHDNNISADISTHLKQLYEGSLGCIGLLRKWIVNMYAISTATGKPIDKLLLEQSKSPYSDLQVIAAEILAGENMMETSEAKYKASNLAPQIEKTKGTSRPFQRNPKRYKSGNRNE